MVKDKLLNQLKNELNEQNFKYEVMIDDVER